MKYSKSKLIEEDRAADSKVTMGKPRHLVPGTAEWAAAAATAATAAEEETRTVTKKQSAAQSSESFPSGGLVSGWTIVADSWEKLYLPADSDSDTNTDRDEEEGGEEEEEEEEDGEEGESDKELKELQSIYVAPQSWNRALVSNRSIVGTSCNGPFPYRYQQQAPSDSPDSPLVSYSAAYKTRPLYAVSFSAITLKSENKYNPKPPTVAVENLTAFPSYDYWIHLALLCVNKHLLGNSEQLVDADLFDESFALTYRHGEKISFSRAKLCRIIYSDLQDSLYASSISINIDLVSAVDTLFFSHNYSKSRDIHDLTLEEKRTILRDYKGYHAYYEDMCRRSSERILSSITLTAHHRTGTVTSTITKQSAVSQQQVHKKKLSIINETKATKQMKKEKAASLTTEEKLKKKKAKKDNRNEEEAQKRKAEKKEKRRQDRQAAREKKLNQSESQMKN
jgi:hypothetical protein